MNAHKPQNSFSTDHLLKDLKAHTAHGTAVTMLTQGVKFVLQLISIAMLARLLTPADFGLIAMVTVMTGLLGMFRDGGLSAATIQSQDVTHAQVSNLFWINTAIGLALAIITVALAPVLGKIYDEPRLVGICIALSVSFLIGGLSIQHESLLRRQMRFKVVALIEVLSITCGIFLGIALAWAGAGYWALVVMTLFTTATQVVLVWFATDWRPSGPTSDSNVSPMLAFGANLTGANLIGYIASNITPFLVGLLGGTQQLGFYNRASTITGIPSSQILQPVASVAQPALAKISNNPERFRRASLSLVRKICLLAMFVTVSMAVMADWIVEIVLGPGWGNAVPIFRLLSVFSLVEPVATVTALMLIAVGRADEVLKWKIITLVIIVISLSVGAFWGVIGVVAAYALSGLFVRLPLYLAFASRYLPLSKVDFLQAILPHLTLALGLLIALVAMRSQYSPESPGIGVGIYLPTAVAIYILSGLAIKAVRLEIIDLYNTIYFMIQGRRNRNDLLKY